MSGVEWQPIETAPKDNLVDLYAVLGSGGTITTRVPAAQWIGGEWWASGRPIRGAWRVTHWMPIPAPPPGAGR